MDTVNVRIKQKHDTKANWALVEGTFIPMKGEIIVYDDYAVATYEEAGQTKTIDVPGIKVGTGNAYLGDLAFITITPQERAFWNNKLNLIDTIVDEKLVFTRN